MEITKTSDPSNTSSNDTTPLQRGVAKIIIDYISSAYISEIYAVSMEELSDFDESVLYSRYPGLSTLVNTYSKAKIYRSREDAITETIRMISKYVKNATIDHSFFEHRGDLCAKVYIKDNKDRIFSSFIVNKHPIESNEL